MNGLPAHVAHAAPGRVRLRLRDPLSPEEMEGLVERIAACGGGISRVAGRPNTGSVIVETGESAEALTARLAAEGIVKPVARPRPPPLRDAARLGVLQADAAVSARTEGFLDARAAVALIFLGVAVFQASRGRLFGPAATMLGLALSLMQDQKGGRG